MAPRREMAASPRRVAQASWPRATQWYWGSNYDITTEYPDLPVR